MALFDRGKIVLAGAATDGAIGIIVWRVDSAEAGMVKQIFMLNRSYEE